MIFLPGKYRKIAYFIYLTAVAGLFLFLLFPDDAVRDFVKRGVASSGPDVTVDIGRVNPAFPPGLTFKTVSLFYKKAPVAQPDYIRITPRLLSLLGSSPRFVFKAGVLEGIIKGDGEMTEDTGTDADIQMSGLQLGKIDLLNDLSPHRISGQMDGSVKVTARGKRVQADSSLVFSDFEVALAQPVFGMERLTFTEVRADLSVSPRRLEIKSCTLSGREFDGEFSGRVFIRPDFQNSALSVKGFVRPQAAFIKEMGRTLPLEMLLKKDAGEKGIPININGTIQDPRISLR